MPCAEIDSHLVGHFREAGWRLLIKCSEADGSQIGFQDLVGWLGLAVKPLEGMVSLGIV
jgi:hypothetical protein